MNSVFLYGRLGADPERKETKNGKVLSVMSLGVHEQTDGGKTRTRWVRIVAFGKLSEMVLSVLRKGMPCMVVGTLDVNTFGEPKRTMYQVIARELFCPEAPTRVAKSESEPDGAPPLDEDAPW